jgi:hypothetical protein
MPDKDQLFSEFQDTIDMSPSELEAFRDSEQREAYAERKSGGQPIDEPLDDVLRLKETPKSEWEDTDDGFNEIEEAREAVNFADRMSANDPGDPIPGTDPPLSKRDASLLNWGSDPNPDRSDFTGDRQR